MRTRDAAKAVALQARGLGFREDVSGMKRNPRMDLDKNSGTGAEGQGQNGYVQVLEQMHIEVAKKTLLYVPKKDKKINRNIRHTLSWNHITKNKKMNSLLQHMDRIDGIMC
ncbi:hypothetical protein ACJX0J_028635, partial [Zea mays]